MRLLDPNFKKNAPAYLIQCFSATVFIALVLFLADTLSNVTVIASLGASTFIALTMPHTQTSRPRFLIGGYCAGILCGISMNYVYAWLLSAHPQFLSLSSHIIPCAAAVGLSMFFMTITNAEHPPAAALAMGLVLEPRVFVTSAVAFVSIVVISLLKQLLKRWLHNLL